VWRGYELFMYVWKLHFKALFLTNKIFTSEFENNLTSTHPVDCQEWFEIHTFKGSILKVYKIIKNQQSASLTSSIFKHMKKYLQATDFLVGIRFEVFLMVCCRHRYGFTAQWLTACTSNRSLKVSPETMFTIQFWNGY